MSEQTRLGTLASCSSSVVRPDDRGPAISDSSPRGSPPASTASSAAAPVGAARSSPLPGWSVVVSVRSSLRTRRADSRAAAAGCGIYSPYVRHTIYSNPIGDQEAKIVGISNKKAGLKTRLYDFPAYLRFPSVRGGSQRTWRFPAYVEADLQVRLVRSYQVSDRPPPPGDATGAMVTRVSCPIVTVQPETMPTAAPNATSLRKCRLSWMREAAT